MLVLCLTACASASQFIIRVGAIPSTPAVTSPACGSTSISTAPTLTWTATGATSYGLIGPDATNPPTTSHSGLGSASYTVSPALSAGVTYYWIAQATSAAGTTSSAVCSFTTAGSGGTPIASNFVQKGIVRLRNNIQIDTRAPIAERYQGTCPGASCKAQLLYLGQIGATGMIFRSTIDSGASTTGARVSLVQGAVPAVNAWLYVDTGGNGGQRYAVHLLTKVFVSGTLWDLTWTAGVVPSTPNVGFTVASEYQQLYVCDLPAVAALTNVIATTSACANETLVGDIYLGRRLVGTTAGSTPAASAAQTYGLFCATTTCDDLYWTYTVNYASQDFIPTLGLTHINWSTKTPTASYGPWRVKNTAPDGAGGTASSPNFVFASMFKLPTAWALTNLGNSLAYGVTGGPTSGTPFPYGATAYAIVGSNIPTAATTGFYQGGVDVDTTPLVAFDDGHRQSRDTNYIAHYGSAPWQPIATGTPTTTQATLSEAAIREADSCSTNGATPSGTVYWCTNLNCDSVHGQGTITSCSGNTLTYTIVSGATPVAGDVFVDARTFSNYAGAFPPVHYTTSAPTNWIDNGVTGVGTPTNGYFIANSDAQPYAVWLKDGSFDALLFGGQISSGHVWYGQANQCGHNHESKTGATSQGNIVETTTPTVAVWDPTDIAAIVAGGSSMANTSSKRPVRQIDMVTSAGFHCASGSDNYPGAQSNQPTWGPMALGFDPQDGTKTTLIVMTPVADQIALNNVFPLVNYYYITP